MNEVNVWSDEKSLCLNAKKDKGDSLLDVSNVTKT